MLTFQSWNWARITKNLLKSCKNITNKRKTIEIYRGIGRKVLENDDGNATKLTKTVLKLSKVSLQIINTVLQNCVDAK